MRMLDTTGLFPATTIGKNKVLAFEQRRETRTSPVYIQTWHQFVQELPNWERDLLNKTRIANATHLSEILNDGDAALFLVSDGEPKIRADRTDGSFRTTQLTALQDADLLEEAT
jgi:hypothetical protein